MARKRNENALGLAMLTSEFSPTNVSLVPRSSHWALTKDEKRLTVEAQKQQLAIEIIAAKARFGASKIGEIHQHAAMTFDEATSFIMERKDQAGRSQLHQTYIDQFSERQIQLLAQHSLAVIDVSATGIGMEVHRSPYPPPPEPEPKRHVGLFQRLFGG